METLIIILFFILAIWFIFQRFKRALDTEQPSCGCNGCGGCKDASQGIGKIEQ